MRVRLAEFARNTSDGKEAARIIGSCVHCGFCTATCPTYQVLDHELDSPRGRIYLIKQMLEGGPVSGTTRNHLDLCLSCRGCETTCPTGVEYGRLVDIGRAMASEQAPRSWALRLVRSAVRQFLLARPLFSLSLKSTRAIRPLLPDVLAKRIPEAPPAGPWPVARHSRKVIVLYGCVQPALAPRIDAALARVLDQAGVSLIHVARSGCCGAVSQHLDNRADALQRARQNIDAWWPHIEANAEAIVATASGCGSMLKDYGYLLRDDPLYAAKAARISELQLDTAQIIGRYWNVLRDKLVPLAEPHALAFHPPCSLQHGLKVRGDTEKILLDMGYTLKTVRDAHLCCGSAGTYSIFNPHVANELRLRKLSSLQEHDPECIVTSNFSCITHLQSGTATPIRHWIEILDERLQA